MVVEAEWCGWLVKVEVEEVVGAERVEVTVEEVAEQEDV